MVLAAAERDLLQRTGAIISREALEEMKFGDIHVPKGLNIWLLPATLHQDPEIWEPDADKFNPERFANGVSGACKFPRIRTPYMFQTAFCLGRAQAISCSCSVKLHNLSLTKI
ncbi:hypothetical protein CRYUN_Cryun09bG0077100 [Craigia yunnanensis]